MKKPRPFNHRLIYIDDRQERLAEMKQHAFTLPRNKRQGRVAMSVPMLLSVVLILLATILLIVFSH